MAADDTSREALIERVENLLMDERDKHPRVHNDAPSADLAEAVVDAVVMPLLQERDELRAENDRLRDTARNYEIAMYGARGERDSERAERDAAIKRAEAAELRADMAEGDLELASRDRDTYRDRWRQLMRDHEAVVKERDLLETANAELISSIRARLAGDQPVAGWMGDIFALLDRHEVKP